jgi:phosphatidylglycerol:prolipoprotein diacylglycerol transferase
MPCTIAYGLWKRVPIRHGMDIIAPALMVGLAFGRIGCFMNGCCYGATCDIPHLGVQFPYYSNTYVEQFQDGHIDAETNLLRQLESGRVVLKTPAELRAEFGEAEAAQIMGENRSSPVHPAQLYSAFTAFFLAGLLVAFFTLPHAQGSIFMSMLVLEGATRFVLELLRAEPAVAQTTWGAMSFSMFISIGLVVAGIVGYLVIRRMAPRSDVLTMTLDDAQTKHHARGLAARV